MTTPNDLLDQKTRIQLAKAFLTEHPEESITTASRIYQLTRTTLSSSIHTTPHLHRRGGQNRILTLTQEQSINRFIQSYLEHGHLPTKGVILGAITHLRKLESLPPPSESWFKKWWKTQPIHKIKTKPIARDRISAQDTKEVKEWFKKYREVVDKYHVQKQDIFNFDEPGFRVGCPRGEEIYVPLDVKEVRFIYFISNILINYSGTLLAPKIDVQLQSLRQLQPVDSHSLQS
jgi:hypothetical protein